MSQKINGRPLTSALLGLPEELLIEVLKNLDFRDILRCCLVCRLLQSTVAGSLELQYKIELGADGLVDGPPSALTTADRLQLLLDRRRRWRSLDWVRQESVPIAGGCQAYELVDGVFAKSMGGGFGTGSRHFTTVRLPSRSEPASVNVRDDVGIPTRDFAMDPSQDLVALVHNDDGDAMFPRVIIHLHTLSTNSPHPKAEFPRITASVPFETGSSVIQVVDDVIGLFFWAHGPGILIWNWHTGVLLVNLLPPMAWDFAFISNRAFIVTATSGSLRRIASLGMPPIRPSQEMQSFSTHSGPFVHSPGAGKPFYPSHEMCAHLFDLNYGDRGPRFLLFVPNRFFLSLIPVGGERRGPWHTLERPWDTWGPMNSRVLRRRSMFQWLRYIHGHRLVFPPPPAALHDELPLVVYDFNVHPKRLNDPVQKPVNYKEVTLPEVLRAENTFEEDVITYLPYACSVKADSFQYSGLMIDDERIIGMKVCASIQMSIHADMDTVTSTSSCNSLTWSHFKAIRPVTMSNGTEPQVLVEIPDAIAAHVLGQSSVVLGEGTLAIVSTQSSSLAAPAQGGFEDTPILTLTVGSAAFPLFRTSTFGTLANGDYRTYVFTPEIGSEKGGYVCCIHYRMATAHTSVGYTSYVQITLPQGVEEAESMLSQLQTRFEQVLVDYGLLKEGVEANADELGKSVRDESAVLAQNVKDSVPPYLTQYPPTTSPASFTETGHSVMASSASGTGSLAATAWQLTNAVSTAAGQAGAWVAGRFVPTTESNTETLQSTANAWDITSDGVSAGLSEVRSAAGDAAGKIVENDYGPEAREVLGNAATSAGNVGAVAGAAMEVTSGAAFATAGLRGAAASQTKQQERKNRTEAEGEVLVEGNWKDVPI
ncbi:hypothetical protein OBBRIDRAFT_739112 [Obba rivulosa]|uniref:F-box domain-containing protein n=1 Tax=Obba rivulosa TaxID=1052685 RepID=A0A8E2AJT0_9APHY|nr:hypothetical protein OBBRIDRAFT_739112 [Obba rivulosa]